MHCPAPHPAGAGPRAGRDSGRGAEQDHRSKDGFFAALSEMQPSSLREVLVESPNTHWDEIGGLEEAKRGSAEAVEWPLDYGPVFDQMHATPPKGILLYGPPGTGKTMLAKAVATESEANFINVKGPEFLFKWVGESEKAVRETFRKARPASPCIVFMDEIDRSARPGGEGPNSHVTERGLADAGGVLDGLESLHNVMVIGATNRPDMLDPAILRPGRFDRMIKIGPPDLAARKEILKVHAKGKPLAADVDLNEIARRTEGYTGADIAAVVNEATMIAIRRSWPRTRIKPCGQEGEDRHGLLQRGAHPDQAGVARGAGKYEKIVKDFEM